LLNTLGCSQAAQAIQQAVDHVLQQQVWTPDLGGNATTAEVTDAVVKRL
jgi:isocitrate/isopropylmalate dehydrogenase